VTGSLVRNDKFFTAAVSKFLKKMIADSQLNGGRIVNDSVTKLIVGVILGLQIPVMAGLGLLFWHGRGAGLVIHSRRERYMTDVPRLLRFLAKLMFALAACWVPVTLGTLLDRTWLLFLGLGLFMAVAVGGAIYANTGKQFRKF